MSQFALFDLDGTLTDPREGIVKSIQYAFERLDEDVPPFDSLLSWIGPSLLDSFQDGLQCDRAKAGQALNFYRERFSDVGLYENELIPGIVDSLETFKQHSLQLYVATSKPWVYAQKICEHFKIDHYFEHVHGSELDGTRVNKVELVEYILEQHGLTGGDGVMIGDRKHDIDGGSKNGLCTVGVLWGFGAVEELQRAGANIIVMETGLLFDSCERALTQHVSV